MHAYLTVSPSLQAPAEELWNGQISGYYIGYFPVGSKQEHYKVIETSKRGHSNQHLDRYEAHLTNLARSTRYTAFVRAFNAKGKGPPSEEVTVKTLDDVPPTAPTVRVLSSSTSSVTLAWTSLTSMGNTGVNQFTLYQKKLGNQREAWKEIAIATKEMLYAINNLECGQSYEFYMTAHNSVGKSEPSVTVVARTDGAPPLSAHQDDFFVRLTAHEALVSLTKWKSGGCPISYFSLRIRPKLGRDWAVLTARHTSWQENFNVRNLQANTLYEVEVVAHNSAGATQAQYEFQTKSLG